MRKLRQGMDSLCKTSRLVCSVLRLQQLKEAVNLSHDIKYRRYKIIVKMVYAPFIK